MSDIRIAMDQLTQPNRVAFLTARAEMRRTFLTTHSDALGVHNWDTSDDVVFDMLDLKLLQLYQRGGQLLVTDETAKRDGQLAELHKQIESDLANGKIQHNPANTAVGEWKA